MYRDTNEEVIHEITGETAKVIWRAFYVLSSRMLLGTIDGFVLWYKFISPNPSFMLEFDSWTVLKGGVYDPNEDTYYCEYRVVDNKRKELFRFRIYTKEDRVVVFSRLPLIEVFKFLDKLINTVYSYVVSLDLRDELLDLVPRVVPWLSHVNPEVGKVIREIHRKSLLYVDVSNVVSKEEYERYRYELEPVILDDISINDLMIKMAFYNPKDYVLYIYVNLPFRDSDVTMILSLGILEENGSQIPVFRVYIYPDSRLSYPALKRYLGILDSWCSIAEITVEEIAERNREHTALLENLQLFSRSLKEACKIVREYNEAYQASAEQRSAVS
ncbi:MAG: hypothetical protein QXY11_03225 [Desulfurococcaceae archaeon]